MTKTIEEAAIEYAEQNYFREDDRYSFRENTDSSIKASAYAFEEGANHVYNLPLASRLTAEEKERVRKIYVECELLEMDDSPNLPADRLTEAGAKVQVLESIFGADFFKEGE